MKSLYYILIINLIGSSISSPLMAQCTGNACYITINNPSLTKVTSSTHRDIKYKKPPLRVNSYTPIIATSFILEDKNQYCQFSETLVIVTRDTFECVEDISTWIEV